MNGVDDVINVWLLEFAAGLDKNPTTFASELCGQLSKKYTEVARGR